MLFIDFEVFKHNWLCVAVDPQTKKEFVIVDDKEGLEKLYSDYKRDIFIGFNIRNYDKYIMQSILCDFNPKEVNDYIIVKKKKGYQFSSQFNKFPLIIFDVMPNPPVGLKTLEGFMGLNIHETDVPFDIDRPLTQEEIESTIGYCRDDVHNTMKVFAEKLEEFTSQLELVKMFSMSVDCMGRTKAQLSAMILGASKNSSRGDDIEFCIPKTLRIKKYQFVVDWFLKVQDHAREYEKEWGLDPALDELYSQKLECEIAGVPHVFAFGGIHGAIPNYHGKGYFVNVDVASYYPTMMIHYGYHSRNIHDPKKFDEIYHTRLEYKAKKDKRANPLKIVLNSTYGAMKDKYNPLFDPLMANNVCVTGQLLLLDLIEHLEDRFDIIQSNTDGILIKLRATTEAEASREYAELDDRCFEWEQRSGMTLEFDEFRQVIQRDVNNYIIVDEHGKYKSKGGEVKKLHNLDYDLPIVNKAMVDYFIKGIPVEKTINDCDDLRDFQNIYKISSLYKYGQHNGQKLSDRTFRVFASTKSENTALFKVKDKGEKGLVPEKFANCPDHCFIDNGDVKGKPVPKELDRNWYIALAKKRIERFVNETA